jgi:hypothetical protein
LKALAPSTTVEATQKSLSECIVDGTMSPGTSSEKFGIEEGGERARFTETLSNESSEISREAALVGASKRFMMVFRTFCGYVAKRREPRATSCS